MQLLFVYSTSKWFWYTTRAGFHHQELELGVRPYICLPNFKCL